MLFGPIFRRRSSSYGGTSCVGLTFQFLEILQYVCGLKREPALILNQNSIFGVALNTYAGLSDKV